MCIQQEILLAASWKVQCISLEFSAYSMYHYTRIFDKLIKSTNKRMLCWAGYLPPIILPSRFGSKDTSLQNPVGSTLGRPDAGLSEILLATKDLKCTDDRGRLHGVMLLANNVAESDIDADYSLSAAETFMKVPQYWIERHRCLDFIQKKRTETERTLIALSLGVA